MWLRSLEPPQALAQEQQVLLGLRLELAALLPQHLLLQ
jgi:hypothetical protein